MASRGIESRSRVLAELEVLALDHCAHDLAQIYSNGLDAFAYFFISTKTPNLLLRSFAKKIRSFIFGIRCETPTGVPEGAKLIDLRDQVIGTFHRYMIYSHSASYN